jgi:hypothetical protein
MTDFNGVKLVGDVSDISRSGFTLSMSNTANSGETFIENIDVICTSKNQPDWLAEGKKAAVKGQLTERTGVQMVKAISVTKPAKDAEYMNLARLIGTLRYSFAGQYFDPKPGKQAFGNMAIAVGKNIYRAVLFGALATVFSRTVKTGNLVRVQGFLRKREFFTRAGESRTALEVIADPDWTTILESSTNDQFADFDEEPLTEADGAAF